MAGFRKNEIDLTEGKYLPKLIRFALPIMVTGVLQLMFNAVDSMVVGQFVGDGALAAVTSTGALITLIVNLFLGISVGSNVLAAQYYGAKREKDVTEVLHTSVVLSLILGIVVLLIGQFFSRTFLNWMGSPDDVIDDAALYLKIYFIGAPFSLLYNFSAAILRAAGDTKHPLIFLTIGGVLNVFLNLFCVLVLHLGVEGVAIGTIVSQFVSAVLVTVYYFSGKAPVRLVLKDLKISWKKLKTILMIGIPAGVQSIMFSISNVIIQSAVNSFGKIILAGNGAANQIDNITYTAMQSVAQTSINFVGQNVGAKKYDRIRRGLWILLGMVSAVGLVFGGGMYLLGPQLLGIFTSTPESIEAGMLKLLFLGVPYFIGGIMDTLAGAVRGLGTSIAPMVVAILGTCVLRVVWIMTVFQQYHTLESLFVTYPISWAVSAVGHGVCFLILFRRMRRKLENLPRQKRLRAENP